MIMMIMMTLLLWAVVSMLHCWKPTKQIHIYFHATFSPWIIIIFLATVVPGSSVNTKHTHTHMLGYAHITDPAKLKAEVAGQPLQHLHHSHRRTDSTCITNGQIIHTGLCEMQNCPCALAPYQVGTFGECKGLWYAIGRRVSGLQNQYGHRSRQKAVCPCPHRSIQSSVNWLSYLCKVARRWRTQYRNSSMFWSEIPNRNPCSRSQRL